MGWGCTKPSSTTLKFRPNPTTLSPPLKIELFAVISLTGFCAVFQSWRDTRPHLTKFTCAPLSTKIFRGSKLPFGNYTSMSSNIWMWRPSPFKPPPATLWAAPTSAWQFEFFFLFRGKLWDLGEAGAPPPNSPSDPPPSDSASDQLGGNSVSKTTSPSCFSSAFGVLGALGAPPSAKPLRGDSQPTRGVYDPSA